MKNLTQLILFLLFPLILISQTTEDLKKITSQSNLLQLKSISESEKIRFFENKKEALALAEKYNWPLKLTKGNTYSELVGVNSDQLPIYYTTNNEGAGITSRANKLYSGGSLGLNINGENMTAAVWDAAAGLATHELFTGRLEVLDGTFWTHPHATHVAGTIIGTDGVQNGKARGMAYKANVKSYDWNSDTSEVATAAAAGLLLSNHSYGINPLSLSTSSWGKYDEKAKTFDNIMFNAPFYQFVCAAGNSRGPYNTLKNGYDVMSGHTLSKNGIAVAAVKEVLNYTGPNSVQMSSFSSWGPTDDGRIKPDISAKGVDTFSATDDSNSSYGTKSGTSMASPSVAGTLLLFQQYYKQLHANFMKAATLRGLMIHTADEAGSSNGPDYSFGWGLINAEKAASVIKKNQTESFIFEKTLTQNGTFSINVNSNGVEPLIATICWTDPTGNLPGSATDDATTMLVNDLDLRINQDNNTYYPWKLDVANPSNAATKGDNLVDNVEKAEIANATGSYTITVSHKGTLLNNTQNYSLIISGVNVRNYWVTSSQKSKSICEGTDSTSFDFQYFTKSNFNETVLFSTVNLPVNITAAFSPVSMSAPGNVGLTLNNLTSLAPGSYSFVVKAATATDSYEIPLTVIVLTNTFQNVVLLQPANNSNNIQLPVAFNWQASLNAQQYDIEIARDSNFSSIVQVATVTQNSFTSSVLSNNTTYFWHIKPKNICGMGVFSVTSTFTTICSLPTRIIQLSASATTAKVRWTENAGGTSWIVELVPEGTTPTGNGTLVTSNPYMFTGLNSNTCYDFYIKSTCSSGTSSWTAKTKICTQPNYCGGDHFVDSGGLNGNYLNNEYKTTTIFPTNSGERIKAVFNAFNIETGYDFLQIYNGPNTSYPLLYAATGTTIPAYLTSNDSTGALTFVFSSDYYGTSSGWDATIICEPMPACPIEPSNISGSNITYHSALINWTENTNATSWNIEILPIGSMPTGNGVLVTTKPYFVSNLAPNTRYNVFIRSNCAAGTSGWSIPYSFTTVGNYCAGDHFYDDGGPNSNCIKSYFYQTIYPDATGNRIKAIFNSFSLNNYANFYIYNGTSSNAPVLYYWDGVTNPETIRATNSAGALTFVFYSFDTSNAAGWDATIVCDHLPLCQNPPDAVLLTSSTTTTATFSWSENSGASAWEIEVVPQGTIPIGVGTIITSMPYTVSGLTSNTWYDLYIRSRCTTDNSDWSTKYVFNTNANYCTGDHFYDNGGPNGNYQRYISQNVTIAPTGTGNRVKAIFNSFNLNNSDSFSVYDGSTLIYARNASYPIAPTTLVATNLQGTLSFQFTSYSGTTNQGWDATIVCEPLPPCAQAPKINNFNNITTTTAQIYWTENSGATSWEMEIVPQGITPGGVGFLVSTNPYTKTGLSSNTWYDVYVRSKCGGVNSAWSQKSTFNTLANYCSGDHFYDNGGPNGNYRQFSSQYVTVAPTGTGNRVKAIFNSFSLNDSDSFNVYDGNTLIFSRNSNNPIAPTTLIASNLQGTLSFHFSSSSATTNPGWDATIICEPLPPCSLLPDNVYVSNITTTTTKINWTENSGATSWEIEFVPQGTTPTGVGSVVSANPYIKTGLISNTWYDVYVRSRCGSVNSAWSQKATFNTLANYCAGDHFYDNGGPNGNYQLYSIQNVTISPTGTGNRVKAIFNLFDLDNYDSFAVYDGSNLIFSRNSSNPIAPTTLVATNLQGTLSIQFSSYSGTTHQGWDATIICEPLPPCAQAPSVGNFSSITTTTAQINWNENAGAISWEIEIVPQGSLPTGVGFIVSTNPYVKTGLSSNSWYDVYVRSKCGSVNSTWSQKATFNTLPNYCSGDHFYDNGGPNGRYIRDQSQYVTISPTGTGNRVKAIFNSFEIGIYDSFKIYDGNTLVYSRSTSNQPPPTTITATNLQGELTFQFSPQSGATYQGWDASIVCEPIPGCSFAPSGVLFSNITRNSILISWTENASANSWEIEVVPIGSSPTGSGIIVLSNPYQLQGLNANTCYSLYIRSICGSQHSNWITAQSFCTAPDYCSGTHFTDSGGLNGYYQNNENITTVIYPNSPSDKVKAIFNSFQTESGYDYLKIYNGPSVNSPLLFSGSGSAFPGTIMSTHATGALTFSFTSDGSTVNLGWDATIQCVQVQPCSIVPSEVSFNNILIDKALVSWAESTSAASWEIKVVVSGTSPTNGSGIVVNTTSYQIQGLTSNTCYDVYIRSFCGTQYSNWTSAQRFCTAANYCGGDHFTDSGGISGNYGEYENKTTVIYPGTPGDKVKVVFNTFNTGYHSDYLKIYDGPDANSPLLTSASGPISVGAFISTHPTGALTFVFTSDGFPNYSGWDATVSCGQFTPCSDSPSNITFSNLSTTSAEISWTENSVASSWQVEIVPQGSAPTGVGITFYSTNYYVSGLASNTWYDVYIRSLCENVNSPWSPKATFNTLGNYCAGDHFYDNGGPMGNYIQNSIQNVTISPSGFGLRVKATFNSFNLSNSDSFKVYDGDILIFSRDANNPISPTVLGATNLQGTLTFQFASNSPITNQGWDATIECELFPQCARTPANITSTDSSTDSIQISWVEYSDVTSWEVEAVPHGTLPTGIGTITTSNPYTLSGLTSNTWYDFYIRSICGNVISAWTPKSTFYTKGEYCLGDHFYDNGGPNENYLLNSYQYITLTPTQTGNRVKAIFNSFSLNDSDSFNVYDGSNLIFSRNSNNLIVPTTLVATNSQGTLDVEFTSSGLTTSQGWDATIVCEPFPPCSVVPDNVNFSHIVYNMAQIGWVDQSGASSWEIEIVPSGGSPTGTGMIVLSNPFTITGLSATTCYEVYIRSICGNEFSAWSDVQLLCTIPDFCNGAHFVDSGGINGNYQNNETKITTIYPDAPGNKVKVVFNTFETEPGADYLRIYNGPNVNSPIMFTASGTNSPNTKISTHATGALTFKFSSNGSSTAAGWDATVQCNYLGIYNEEIPDEFIKYAPNPVIDILNINSKINIKKIEVFDVNARLLVSKNINNDVFSINLSSFSEGLYFVKLFDNEQKSKTIKIIKGQ